MYFYFERRPSDICENSLYNLLNPNDSPNEEDPAVGCFVFGEKEGKQFISSDTIFLQHTTSTNTNNSS